MVCGQNHAPATLPNFVYMHITNRKFLGIPVIFETKSVCFYDKLLTHFLLKKCLSLLFCQHIPRRSLVHSANHCCYRNFYIRRRRCSTIFLLCTSLHGTTSCCDSYIALMVAKAVRYVEINRLICKY
jgi:hypothetical protein